MPKPMAVNIRGVIYPDAKAAAKALGVSVMTIYSALSRGTTDTCGLGTGRTRKVNKGGNPRSFTIGNLTFRTLKEASLALGYEQSSLSNILRSGKERARANLLRRALKISAERENAAMNAILKQRS